MYTCFLCLFRPKIVSQDGHLIFMTGTNHNITFRPSAGGAINLDGESLQAIVNMVSLRDGVVI